MGVTSVRLNSEVEVPLETLANKLDRSKNYLINQAIKEFVQRQSMEDARWEDTLEALSLINAGKPLMEMMLLGGLKAGELKKSYRHQKYEHSIFSRGNRRFSSAKSVYRGKKSICCKTSCGKDSDWYREIRVVP